MGFFNEIDSYSRSIIFSSGDRDDLNVIKFVNVKPDVVSKRLTDRNTLATDSSITAGDLKTLAGISKGVVKAGGVLVVDEDNQIGIQDGISIDFDKGIIQDKMTIDLTGGESLTDRFGTITTTGPSIQNIQAIQFTPKKDSGTEFKNLNLTYSHILFLRSFFKDFLGDDSPEAALTKSDEAGKTLSEIAGGKTVFGR